MPYLKKITLLFTISIISLSAFSQKKAVQQGQELARPKLVVGIVIDQMRWDYLYRFYSRYGATGFKRLLNQGFTCENTLINYVPTLTAIGHSSIFTGSVPAIHGIAGNDWIDRESGKLVYCTGDSTETTIGAPGNEGKMSPRNLLASTITDELAVATNFRSKIVGISLKDRAAILPAGHTPTGAFWLDDKSGNFITSSYYMKQLPEWVDKFNKERNAERLIAKDWHTLYPIETYGQSTADNVPWEGKLKGESNPVFPHLLAEAYKSAPVTLRQTPFGNTLTLNFAKRAITGYGLGTGSDTDFLTVNCAATDYSGHLVGPNSIEIEDIYLRLDQDLGLFFDELDKKVGKGNYLVFLTADHGAANAIKFNQAHNIPADALNSKELTNGLNKFLKGKFGINDNLIKSFRSYQFLYSQELIAKNKLKFSEVKQESVDYLRQQPGVQFAMDLDNVQNSTLPDLIKERVINGYNYKRHGDVQVINNPGWFSTGSTTGTSHGTYSAYDAHIPLVFMGWGVKQGSTNRETHITDIAPTIAAFLHVQMPNGAIGKPITEVLQK